jgi:hypothetical protein
MLRKSGCVPIEEQSTIACSKLRVEIGALPIVNKENSIIVGVVNVLRRVEEPD